MQAQPYAPWEVRSSILSGRADTLKTIARDKSLPLSAANRAVLERIAEIVIAEAHAVVRKG